VRREITAQIVWCYQALGRTAEACEEFLLIVRSDPQTIHFDCIPLAWVPGQPPVALERKAREWLDRKDLAVARLLGASHLLSSSVRQSALARLEELASESDARVAQLAAAQTWRAQVVSADDAQLRAWEAAVEAMPEPLRAGPYCVLARGWAQRGNPEQAALAWLRVPVVYPRHRVLAARALVESGRALEKLDRDRQAARLYDEAARMYPDTPSAAEARAALEAIGKEHAG
jgi:tetratricopeptide (TPR) repeat protein